MTRTRIVVVGNGMAGSRLAEELRRRDPDGARLDIVVIGAEAHPAYNRILLSNVLAGSITGRDTRLKPDGWWERQGIDVRSGVRVTGIDTAARTVRCDDGTGSGHEEIGYDELVLATGSRSFIPPIAGAVDESGTLVDGVAAFRTIGDCDQIIAAATGGSSAVVLGGGLLGLEAARGLLMRGMDVTVVHPKDFPMERQLDPAGGAVLTRVLTELGMRMVLGRRAVARDAENRTVVLDDETELPADLLVLSAGIRPEVSLAESAGIAIDQAIVVDDLLRTSAPRVSAIGECAQHRGEVYGLVQPGWEQAAVVAERLAGENRFATYHGTANVTRLKAHDIDLASMGDISAEMHCSHSEVLTLADPTRGRYAKVVVREDRVVGAVLLGNPDVVGTLTQLFDAQLPVPVDRMSLLIGRGSGAGVEVASPATMPGSAVVCRCNSVTKSQLTTAWKAGSRSVAAMATETRATTGCGGCSSVVHGICEWLRNSDPEPRDQPAHETPSIEEEGAA
ncbi:FAD-dependent oxidoreductase [Rhodococcus sp. PvR099]|uniref:FAD-dependent oxidoreductase n=1 Tax=Rhodococcus sp. PvR099 TaxID=2806602 RepID=UPI001AE4BBD7|nr:FAD-dependent oxidoreductase [Rhodococcus sp. PvR099]MBP1163095.1 assimilatory nitrate reductase electron transfer subunit [Rhodococcus sp. PvR099]